MSSKCTRADLVRRRTALLLAGLIATVGLAAGVGSADAATNKPKPAGSWQRLPTNNEIALLALANMARSQPSLDRSGGEPVTRPMIWVGALAAAGRFHSADMGTNGCYQHDSCNGQNWAKRVNSFFSAWGLGENYIFGWDPRGIHDLWMGSPGHRANILNGSFQVFGAGLAPGHDGFGSFDLATEDFGAILTSPPTIPAAAVIPPGNTTPNTLQWELLLNYYSTDSAPTVKAFVDGHAITLTQFTGVSVNNSSWHAMYTTNGDATTFCKNVYFQVTNSQGTFRYPKTGTMPLGASDDCKARPIDDGDAAPVVDLTGVTNGATVTRNLRLAATAAGYGLRAVGIYVDGNLLAEGSYKVKKTWNARSKAVSAGPHTIVVKADDDSGRVTTQTFNVTVVK